MMKCLKFLITYTFIGLSPVIAMTGEQPFLFENTWSSKPNCQGFTIKMDRKILDFSPFEMSCKVKNYYNERQSNYHVIIAECTHEHQKKNGYDSAIIVDITSAEDKTKLKFINSFFLPDEFYVCTK